MIRLLHKKIQRARIKELSIFHHFDAGGKIVFIYLKMGMKRLSWVARVKRDSGFRKNGHEETFLGRSR